MNFGNFVANQSIQMQAPCPTTGLSHRIESNWRKIWEADLWHTNTPHRPPSTHTRPSNHCLPVLSNSEKKFFQLIWLICRYKGLFLIWKMLLKSHHILVFCFNLFMLSTWLLSFLFLFFSTLCGFLHIITPSLVWIWQNTWAMWMKRGRKKRRRHDIIKFIVSHLKIQKT